MKARAARRSGQLAGAHEAVIALKAIIQNADLDLLAGNAGLVQALHLRQPHPLAYPFTEAAGRVGRQRVIHRLGVHEVQLVQASHGFDAVQGQPSVDHVVKDRGDLAALGLDSVAQCFSLRLRSGKQAHTGLTVGIRDAKLLGLLGKVEGALGAVTVDQSQEVPGDFVGARGQRRVLGISLKRQIEVHGDAEQGVFQGTVAAFPRRFARGVRLFRGGRLGLPQLLADGAQFVLDRLALHTNRQCSRPEQDKPAQ